MASYPKVIPVSTQISRSSGHSGKSRVFTGLLVLTSLGLLVAAGCNYSEDGKQEETKFATTQTHTFGAAGSTFVAPLISRWAKDYQGLHQVQVNYRAIGSGGGINELKQGLLTFAASDAPLGDDELKGMRPIVQIPVTAGPVSVIYNVPSVNVPLKLSGKTLAGIFSGGIISWQDPAIARENPGTKLPHAAIIVVHRSDGSGTTDIFTNYLSSVSPEWSAKAGHGLSVNWPVGIGAEGSKHVLHTVKQTAGTIGYLELSYAKEAGLPVALIQNKAGEFIVPSPESASLAINAFSDALEKDLRTPIVDPPSSAKGAYPISGMTFVLIPRDNPISGEQQVFKDFITYAITLGQDSAEALSYTKLPVPIQQQSQTLLAQLTDNGQPLK